MKISRRRMLSQLCTAAFAPRLLAQSGMASRGLTQGPRPAPSGRPFAAHFTDVAASAGLVAPEIYGGIDHKDYILEADGCGCAFIDYDYDGWFDIFMLTGTRVAGAPPGTSNRLYINNRDCTFTDITEEAGLRHVGWASAVCVGDYNNDGNEDLFCTYYGENKLYRNNGDGTFTDVTEQAGLSIASDKFSWGGRLLICGLRSRWKVRSLHFKLHSDSDPSAVPKPRRPIPTRNWKGIPVNCGPRRSSARIS